MGSLTTVRIVGSALVALAVMVPTNTTAYSTPGGGGQVVTSAAAGSRPTREPRLFGQYKNVVVIFQENHSFDNLYGRWGKVGRNRVNGLSRADTAHTTQADQNGGAYACLLQNDVNLASPPLDTSCTDSSHGISSAFTNKSFLIDKYIKPTDTTCPIAGSPSAPNGVPKGAGEVGGCTRDLVHRFYQEKYQINGGRQNRYVTGSDAVGLTMGTYATKQLPIYTYLHQKGAPNYVIADRFFQGANGGSFLNHQWLIAGRAPYVDQTAAVPNPDLRPVNSLLDANGMPNTYPLYKPTITSPVDGGLTTNCVDPTQLENYEQACGNFAVNTVQPSSLPYSSGGRFIPLIDDTKYPNIGDRLTEKRISWAWYSGGWNEAEGGNPGPLFQYHHQPFNYFAAYAKGEPGRDHLQDEKDFTRAARIGNLPTVSFVKPYGAENEHPGYASATGGSMHLVDLIKDVQSGPQAEDTLIIVTYDEFGGQWDHVPPPGAGSPTRGAYDAFGPGTRIPALLLSARMKRSGVDHTSYDTTSIIASLERSFGLEPVGIRDTKVADLRRAIRLGGHHR